jgi:hypothetical protein
VRFSWELISTGHFTPGHHESDLATKDLLIEFEGGFTLGVEIQIWIQLHTKLLLVKRLKKLMQFRVQALACVFD